MKISNTHENLDDGDNNGKLLALCTGVLLFLPIMIVLLWYRINPLWSILCYVAYLLAIIVIIRIWPFKKNSSAVVS